MGSALSVPRAFRRNVVLRRTPWGAPWAMPEPASGNQSGSISWLCRACSKARRQPGYPRLHDSWGGMTGNASRYCGRARIAGWWVPRPSTSVDCSWTSHLWARLWYPMYNGWWQVRNSGWDGRLTVLYGLSKNESHLSSADRRGQSVCSRKVPLCLSSRAHRLQRTIVHRS